MARRGLFLLLFLVAGSSVACSSHEQHPAQIGDCMGPANACLNATVGSGAASSVDGGKCGVLTFPEPCETCVETNCCSLVGLCSNNSDCLALYVGCISGCTTQSCVDDCKAKVPSAGADFEALYQCQVSSCSSECGSSDAGTSTMPNDAGTSLGQSCGRLSYQSVACATCVENGCCDPAEMCSSDPDCWLYIQCLAMCKSTDTKCVTDCQTSNPLGFTNSTHFEQCVQDKCSTPCQ